MRFNAVRSDPPKSIHTSFHSDRLHGHPYAKITTHAELEVYLQVFKSGFDFEFTSQDIPCLHCAGSTLTVGSHLPATNDHPDRAGLSTIDQVGDSELPLNHRRNALLPPTELTDPSGDMRPTNVTGERQPLHHAFL